MANEISIVMLQLFTFYSKNYRFSEFKYETIYVLCINWIGWRTDASGEIKGNYSSSLIIVCSAFGYARQKEYSCLFFCLHMPSLTLNLTDFLLGLIKSQEQKFWNFIFWQNMWSAERHVVKLIDEFTWYYPWNVIRTKKNFQHSSRSKYSAFTYE